MNGALFHLIFPDIHTYLKNVFISSLLEYEKKYVAIYCVGYNKHIINCQCMTFATEFYKEIFVFQLAMDRIPSANFDQHETRWPDIAEYHQA